VFDLQAVFSVSVFSFNLSLSSFYFTLLKNGVSSNHHPEWKSTWCTFFTAQNFCPLEPFSNPHTNTVTHSGLPPVLSTSDNFLRTEFFTVKNAFSQCNPTQSLTTVSRTIDTVVH